MAEQNLDWTTSVDTAEALNKLAKLRAEGELTEAAVDSVMESASVVGNILSSAAASDTEEIIPTDLASAMQSGVANLVSGNMGIAGEKAASALKSSLKILNKLKEPGAAILSSVDIDEMIAENPELRSQYGLTDDRALEGGTGLAKGRPRKSRIVFGPKSVGRADIPDSGPNEPNESNVPRLARGILKGTIAEAQKADRRNVGTVRGELILEPKCPYGAVSPFNYVQESDSGHFKEIDDTPGKERIKESHRSGTFWEVGPDGDRVLKVVRDNFSVTIGDDSTKIEGQCAVHVAGDTSLFCEKNIDVLAMGNLSAFGIGMVDVMALGSASLSALGTCSVGSVGPASISSYSTCSVVGTGGVAVQSGGACKVGAAGVVDISSAAAFQSRASTPRFIPLNLESRGLPILNIIFAIIS